MSWPVRIIRYSLYALFFITPVFFLPNTSELFEFNKMVIVYLLSAVIFTAWLLEIISQKKFVFVRTPLDLPILIFLATQLISLLFSVDVRTSIMGYYSRFNGGLLSLLCYSLLYWAFVTFMDKQTVKTSISVSLWVCLLVCFYGILEHFGVDADLWVQDVQNRVFSTLGQPNWLAAYIVTLIFLSLSMSLKRPGFWQLFHPTILILTLLFTRSRSGLLAFGISSAVFWTVLLFKNRSTNNPLSIKGLKTKLAAFALITLTFVLAFPNPVRDLFITPGGTTPGKSDGPVLEVGGTESGVIRQIVWNGAIKSWLSSPKNILIGTGPETFTMAYYQHRPTEHNATSEWNLLYNKAHNEFINFLTTTGIIGLLAYLYLLITMLVFLVKNLILSAKKVDHAGKNPFDSAALINLALVSGWLTIPVTNYWGFSVVIIQVYMFLFPAMVFLINQDSNIDLHSQSPKKFSSFQLLLTLTAIAAGSFLLISTFKYWLADVKYASGQYDIKAFRITEDVNYVLNAYESLGQAFELNPSDPVIAAEFSLANAYISVMVSESDPASSFQLANNALMLSEQAIAQSPHHPNFYKYASQTAMVLGTVYPEKMLLALSVTEKARQISPTDPTIPYSLGIIHVYLDQMDKAKEYFRQALDLKPDYADANRQLQQLASSSAEIQN